VYDGCVGLGPCVSVVDWVGLGEEKWTHVHLCVNLSSIIRHQPAPPHRLRGLGEHCDSIIRQHKALPINYAVWRSAIMKLVNNNGRVLYYC